MDWNSIIEQLRNVDLADLGSIRWIEESVRLGFTDDGCTDKRTILLTEMRQARLSTECQNLLTLLALWDWTDDDLIRLGHIAYSLARKEEPDLRAINEKITPIRDIVSRFRLLDTGFDAAEGPNTSLSSIDIYLKKPKFSLLAKVVLQPALEECGSARVVLTHHVLLVASRSESPWGRILQHHGLAYERLKNAFSGESSPTSSLNSFPTDHLLSPFMKTILDVTEISAPADGIISAELFFLYCLEGIKNRQEIALLKSTGFDLDAAILALSEKKG